MGYDSLEGFVAGVWEDSFMKMDPHNVLAMLWTGQFADIGADPAYNGDFDEALKSIKALTCVMPGEHGFILYSGREQIRGYAYT